MEKGSVRDQLWPNPRMHCTSVSATSISFFQHNLPRGWFHSKKKKKAWRLFPQHCYVKCPLSCSISNMEDILTGDWGKTKMAALFWNGHHWSCVVHDLQRRDRTCQVMWFFGGSVCSQCLFFDKTCMSDLQRGASGAHWKGLPPTFRPLLMKTHLRRPRFDSAREQNRILSVTTHRVRCCNPFILQTAECSSVYSALHFSLGLFFFFFWLSGGIEAVLAPRLRFVPTPWWAQVLLHSTARWQQAVLHGFD